MLSVPDPLFVSYTKDYVEVKGPDGWGLLCAGTLTANAATVACKESKNLFSLRTRTGNHTTYNGTRYAGIIFCDAEDEGMGNCLKFLIKVDRCTGGDVVLDCTTG